MPSHIDQIHFKDALLRGPRIMMVWFLLLLLVAVLSFGILLEGILHAQEPGEREFRPSEATSGALLCRTDQHVYRPAPVLHTDVEMTVSGLIVRTIVRQRFKNENSDWAEGLYVFPLPENAAVDHLNMRIGERIIEGIIKEREEAKKTYERAKTEGKRAGLVEQERPNMFTTSVANIGPGDEITVEIQYQQTLRYDEGLFRLRFPLVVGPRYIPGIPRPIDESRKPNDGHGWGLNTDRVPDGSRITPPVEHPSHGSINPVSLKIDLTPGFPLARLESSYHRIQVSHEQNGRYVITLQDGPVPADRDFELLWEPATGRSPTAAVFTEQKDGEVYTLFMVTPPGLSSVENRRTSREVVFVIDTSGSMHGNSIDQAKGALGLALARLSPDDTFNVIQFNSVTRVLFADSVPAATSNLEKAKRYVSNLAADGGTEMLPAILRALDGREQHARLRQVIFLTDGAVGNEDELFRIIQQRLGDTRLFTIGIGSAPNSHFMRKAAEFGRGTFTYIGSTTEVQQKMDGLFRKLEHPALTDLEITMPTTQVESFPSRIPDLYVGEPLMVVMKTPMRPDRAVIQGRSGSTPWSAELPLETGENRTGLSVFWARAKIDSLMNDHISGTEPDRVRQAVIDVAITHHLVSRYTSLVAVDTTPARPGEKDLKTHALKTNLPHGWDYAHVFGLPQTATTGPLQIMLGIVFVLLALTVLAFRGRRRAT